MRPHSNPRARRKFRRAHVLEEHEWPDHAALVRGKCATHGELPEVGRALLDQQCYRALVLNALCLFGMLVTHMTFLNGLDRSDVVGLELAGVAGEHLLQLARRFLRQPAHPFFVIV